MADLKFVTVYAIARAYSGGHTVCLGFSWYPAVARKISQDLNGLTPSYTHYRTTAIQHGKDIFFVDREKGVFRINPLKKVPRVGMLDKTIATLSPLDPKGEDRKYFGQEHEERKSTLF